jgi:hypothetical protein
MRNLGSCDDPHKRDPRFPLQSNFSRDVRTPWFATREATEVWIDDRPIDELIAIESEIVRR